MENEQGASCADAVARLRTMLGEWKTDYFTADSHPMVERKRDIIKRRIFSIEHEIECTNPFAIVDGVNMEKLYEIGGRQ